MRRVQMRSRICRVLHTCCLQHHSKSLPEVSFAICFRLQVLRPPDVGCSGLPEWEEFRLAAVEHSRLSASLALSLGLLVVLSSLRNGWPDVSERAELDQLEAGNLLGGKEMTACLRLSVGNVTKPRGEVEMGGLQRGAMQDSLSSISTVSAPSQV